MLLRQLLELVLTLGYTLESPLKMTDVCVPLPEIVAIGMGRRTWASGVFATLG